MTIEEPEMFLKYKQYQNDWSSLIWNVRETVTSDDTKYPDFLYIQVALMFGYIVSNSISSVVFV